MAKRKTVAKRKPKRVRRRKNKQVLTSFSRGKRNQKPKGRRRKSRVPGSASRRVGSHRSRVGTFLASNLGRGRGRGKSQSKIKRKRTIKTGSQLSNMNNLGRMRSSLPTSRYMPSTYRDIVRQKNLLTY